SGQRARRGQQAADVSDTAWLSLVRTRATLASKAGKSIAELEPILSMSQLVTEPLARVELLAHVAIGMAHASGPQGAVDELRRAIGEAVRQIATDRWISEILTLRLAILTAPGDVGELLRIYFHASDGLPRDAQLRPTLARLFAQIYGADQITPDGRKVQ